jgi:fibronectin type 3 domain-containing protein
MIRNTFTSHKKPDYIVFIFCNFILLFGSIILIAGCGWDLENIPSASEANIGKITIAWEEVPNAISYNLYFSTSPGVTKFNSYQIPDATNPLSVTQLVPGTTYYFILTVVNASGESEESEELSHTAAGSEGFIKFDKTILPYISSQLTADAVPGTKKVTLTWDKISDAKQYNVYWSKSPGVTKYNGAKISTSKNSVTISGLKGGTTYYFVVTTVSDSAESEESEELHYTIGE